MSCLPPLGLLILPMLTSWYYSNTQWSFLPETVGVLVLETQVIALRHHVRITLDPGFASTGAWHEQVPDLPRLVLVVIKQMAIASTVCEMWGSVCKLPGPTVAGKDR